MKNLKISMKLLLPHILILALLVLGMIVSLVSFTNIRKQADALYKGPFAIKSAVGTVSETLEAMQTAIFRAISNNDQIITGEAITQARNLAESLQEESAQLKQYAFGDMVALARLEANLSELVLMQERVIALVSQNKKSEAAAYMENNNMPVINEARKELAQFIQPAEAKEQELAASLWQAQRKAIIFLTVPGVMGVLFAIRDGAYFWRLYKELKQSSKYHSEQIK